ncbi:MAG TPA: S8 family serine peptidase, partial [Acidimicrobiia bacterium]|nr:S8 family serine peptidase [Acidimicrobiia bacterium]
MRRYLPTLWAFTLLSFLIPVTAVAAPPLQRVIVVLEDGGPGPAEVAQEMARRHGGSVGFVYHHALRGFSISVPAAAVAALAANPQVAYVESDVEVFTTGTQPIPTGIGRVEADLNPASGPLSNVDIAIIDTGVYIGHPDYNLRYVSDCTSAIFYPMFGGCSAEGNHQDENGHGSHVAGIAAAYDNDIGTIGTAPGAVLWSLKALNADGSGYLGSILAAIDTVAAYSADIDVANMSFGFEGSAQSLDDALRNATARGVVFVAAAGNSASDATTFSPANHPDVITVSALADFDGLPGGLGASTCRSDVDDTFADFSNFGAPVDLAAPGVCIYSTYLNNGYATLSGTSMAAPFVTGAVARLLAQGYPKPTNQAQVHALRDALINGGIGQSSECGFSGDPDSLAEPLLFLNSSLFGGNGSCGGGAEPPPNSAPMASFTYSCEDLTCNFTDTSTDSDGS